MDDRQWIVTTALGGLFSAAFLYLPWIGNIWMFLLVAVAQGSYLGWQEVTLPQGRLGYLSFGLGLFVGTGLMGVLLTRTGPGNLWGIEAILGVGAGVVAMFVVQFIRGKRSNTKDTND